MEQWVDRRTVLTSYINEQLGDTLTSLGPVLPDDEQAKNRAFARYQRTRTRCPFPPELDYWPPTMKNPEFKLVGPPCETSECSGVLVRCLCLKKKEVFQRCSECGRDFHRMSAEDALGWVRRIIQGALRGEKPS